MSGRKCNISLIIVLVLLSSIQAFSQQNNYANVLNENNSPKADLKPALHYQIGSTFLAVPHCGSVTSFTLSPHLSIPLSPKLSVDGGLIAGRYYSGIRNFSPDGDMYGAFNELSVYGSASYQLNSHLTFYGTGIKQLAGTSPLNVLPKSSYTVGSTYNFGSFSIGVTLQMSQWNNYGSPFPINGSQGFYSPFEQRPGSMGAFGH
jgi:hypothetical protein